MYLWGLDTGTAELSRRANTQTQTRANLGLIGVVVDGVMRGLW